MERLFPPSFKWVLVFKDLWWIIFSYPPKQMGRNITDSQVWLASSIISVLTLAIQTPPENVFRVCCFVVQIPNLRRCWMSRVTNGRSADPCFVSLDPRFGETSNVFFWKTESAGCVFWVRSWLVANEKIGKKAIVMIICSFSANSQLLVWVVWFGFLGSRYEGDLLVKGQTSNPNQQLTAGWVFVVVAVVPAVVVVYVVESEWI